MTQGAPETNKQLLEKYLNLDQPDDGVMAEYIWIDGTGEGIRSKCRTLYKEPMKPSGKPTHFSLCVRVCVHACVCVRVCVRAYEHARPPAGGFRKYFNLSRTLYLNSHGVLCGCPVTHGFQIAIYASPYLVGVQPPMVFK